MTTTTSSALHPNAPGRGGQLVAAVVLAGAGICACSAAAKEIDLSTRSDPLGVFNVAFCSRPSPGATGIPGHAFVAFSHRKPEGDRDFVAVGHTVSAGVGGVSGTWSYFGPVSGLLKEERYTSVKQNCLDVTVNREDYTRAKSHADDPLRALGLTNGDGVVLQAYRLGSADCMTFAIAVGASLKNRGLKVPDRGALELPAAYVQRLIDAN